MVEPVKIEKAMKKTLKLFNFIICTILVHAYVNAQEEIVITYGDNTTSGNYVFNVPYGVTQAKKVEVWGAGGRGALITDYEKRGGGGAGGYYSRFEQYQLNNPAISLRVGQGGNDRNQNIDGGSGYHGENSFFGNIQSRGGDGVGTNQGGADNDHGFLNNPYGTIQYKGGAGGDGGASGTVGYGGAGGSSAGISSDGTNGANTSTENTSAPSGGGFGGGGAKANGGNGIDGGFPGGGGVRRSWIAGGDQRLPGKGANGQVKVSFDFTMPDVEIVFSDSESSELTVCQYNEVVISVLNPITDLNNHEILYQWKKNGVNIGTPTNSTSITVSGEGEYSAEMIYKLIFTGGSPAEVVKRSSSNVLNINVIQPAESVLSDGDFIWTGKTNSNWDQSSNWVIYENNSYSIPTITPNENINVIIPNNTCIINSLILPALSSQSSKNLMIEDNSGFVMENDSELRISGDFINAGEVTAGLSDIYVAGDWINTGLYYSGESTVLFNGDNKQTIDHNGDFYKVVFDNTNEVSENGSVEIISPIAINYGVEFLNGIVYYSEAGSLTFKQGSYANGSSTNSFVNGIVTKVGSNDFIYPIGDVRWRALPGTNNAFYVVYGGIKIEPYSGFDESTVITVSYNFDNDNMPPYWSFSNNTDADIHHVSDRENWSVETEKDVQAYITLYWEDNNNCATLGHESCIHAFCSAETVADVTEEDENTLEVDFLTIAISNGSMWQNVGFNTANDKTVVVNHNSGAITSREPVMIKGIVSQSKSEESSMNIISYATVDDLMVLPVELISFKAYCTDNGITLEWNTASEINNDYFIVERSVGNVSNFSEIGRVKGCGNSNVINNYSFKDNMVFNETVYYRLKQVDYDMKQKVYEVVSVYCENNQKLFVDVYPMPFNDYINIDLNNISNYDLVLVEIYDEMGKLIYSHNHSTSYHDVHRININTDEFVSSVYYLRIVTGDEVISRKILKCK
jgi:hypothetical protein